MLTKCGFVVNGQDISCVIMKHPLFLTVTACMHEVMLHDHFLNKIADVAYLIEKVLVQFDSAE